jgi:hypothetical protein
LRAIKDTGKMVNVTNQFYEDGAAFRFKQRIDFHGTVAKIVQAINILIFLACAVGYR